MNNTTVSMDNCAKALIIGNYNFFSYLKLTLNKYSYFYRMASHRSIVNGIRIPGEINCNTLKFNRRNTTFQVSQLYIAHVQVQYVQYSTYRYSTHVQYSTYRYSTHVQVYLQYPDAHERSRIFSVRVRWVVALIKGYLRHVTDIYLCISRHI